MVMARKQVIVQLDDALIDGLDALARQLGVSRSELLRRGAETVLRCAQEAADDRALIEAYRRQPPDRILSESAATLAAVTTPEW